MRTRRLAAVVTLLLAALALPAAADLCATCKGKVHTKDVGTCAECRGPTSSGEFALCPVCSGARRECEGCRTRLAPADDLSTEGVRTAGRWEFRLKVANAGTRSEGRFGEVRWDGKPLPAPAQVNDHLRTPWGLLWWAGEPPVPFGDHGWSAKRVPSRPRGRLLADPGGQPQVVVWMTVLVPRAPTAEDAPLEPWIARGLSEAGLSEAVPAGEAAPLGSTPVLLHDSRHYGRAEARLARAAPPDPVAIEVPGTEGAAVEIPCKDGETRILKRTMDSRFGPHDLWLAFQLEVALPKAAPADGSERPPR